MLQGLVNSLFGCSHRRTTFPLTPLRRTGGFQAPNAKRFGTYVTCLDCGKELAYDWAEMRVGKPVSEQTPQPRRNRASFAKSLPYGVRPPRITARVAPVAEGRFDGLRRQVSYASTPNAIASLASGSMP